MSLKKSSLIWLISHITKKTRMTVGAKIFIAFFIVTFTITSAIAFYSMSKIGEKMKGIGQNRATIDLNNMLDQFNEQTRSLEIYARLIADSQELEAALEKNNVKQVYEIITPAKYYSGNDKIQIYNGQGKIIAKLERNNTIHNEENELVSSALAGLTTSGIDINEKGLEIYASTPVNFDPTRYGEHMPAGALIIDRSIDEAELVNLRNNKGAEITIFYGGKLLASSLEQELRPQIMPELLKALNKGDKYQVINVDGERQYLSTWSTIGDTGMMSVMVPNDELLTVSRELTHDISRITVLSGMIVFITSFFIAKFLIAPLSKMMDTTNAIIQGDFSQKVDVFSYDEFGQLGNAINYMLDKIKERIDLAEHLASIDGLTGLYNHRFFQQRLEQELLKAERFNIPISLIIIDIDYFKQYNDTQGHPAGDTVLKQLSQILCRNIRGVDLAARYGGEEFAVILYNTGPEGAYTVGERIRQDVENFPFFGREDQPTGKVTVSMGVASYPVNATKKDDLIKLADDALYKAKYISKNMVVLYYSVLDELKADLDNSDSDLLNTIKTLISVINSKDRYTYGHSERVVQYSVKLAEELQLPEDEIRTIKVGAYLHDIGKIEIDRELLNQEGALDQEQHEVLKQHPSWGAQIISAVKCLKDTVPVVLHHHEKYDGKGYPLGLKGTDIPLAARILKLADSFDAMTSSRPYQGKKSFPEARDEIIRCSNWDFDPEVVEAFLKVLDRDYADRFTAKKGE